jgi:hypothetical protein
MHRNIFPIKVTGPQLVRNGFSTKAILPPTPKHTRQTESAAYNMALHGWFISFINSAVYASSRGFLKLQSDAAEAKIDLAVEWIFSSISKFLNMKEVNLLDQVRYADVDCKKVIDYAKRPLTCPFNKEYIIDCIVRKEVVSCFNKADFTM